MGTLVVVSYRLREGGVGETAQYCEGERVVRLPGGSAYFGELLEKWGFCAPTVVHENTEDVRWYAGRYFGGGQWGPDGTSFSRRLSVGVRWLTGPGGSEPAVSVVAWAWDLGVGWLVPRVVFAPLEGEVLYAPSASRFLDWYASVRIVPRTQLLAPEFGMRLRFPVWGQLWRAGVGYRLGVATPEENRLVVEAGWGAW